MRIYVDIVAAIGYCLFISNYMVLWDMTVIKRKCGNSEIMLEIVGAEQ